MDIFDIIGPIMIGPSSSHTAGAVRIGMVAREVLGMPAVRADIGLVGSFAQTYKGHGTDRALIAGILGMRPDDERVRNSMEIAWKNNIEFNFHEIRLPRVHPNTALIRLTGGDGTECSVQGASVGGGNILINKVNDLETAFSGRQDTLIVLHRDVPGCIAAVTSMMAESGINIGNFRLNRPTKGDLAVMTIELDGRIEDGVVGRLRGLHDITNVVHIRVI